MADVQANAQLAVVRHDPEKGRKIQRPCRVRGERRGLDEKDPAVQGRCESQSPLTCDESPLRGQERGGIKAEGIALHGFLGAFMDHPGGADGIHMAVGSKSLLPEGRIEKKVGLGIPETVSVVGKRNGRRDSISGPDQILGPSSENFQVFGRGNGGKGEDKVFQWRKVKVARKSNKGWRTRISGKPGRHEGRGQKISEAKIIGHEPFLLILMSDKNEGVGSHSGLGIVPKNR